jgi:hypothetical protein
MIPQRSNPTLPTNSQINKYSPQHIKIVNYDPSQQVVSYAYDHRRRLLNEDNQ